MKGTLNEYQLWVEKSVDGFGGIVNGWLIELDWGVMMPDGVVNVCMWK